MKIRSNNLALLFFVLLILPINSIWTQQFVSPANEWFIDDICYGGGNWYIDTYSYKFSDQEVLIDGKMYRELITDSPYPIGINGEGEYYREEDGKIYLRPDENTEEYLIYDYNLELGDELVLGESINNPFTIKVLSIDTIALNSGALRKRMELGLLPSLTPTAIWIEGIGSFNAPMNTLDMFQLDCWTELDCFWQDQEIAHQIGGCELGNFDIIIISNNEIEKGKEIVLSPNPSNETINLIHLHDFSDQEIEIYSISGKLIKKALITSNGEINISMLNPGIYFLSLRGNDGINKTMKFIKK